MGRKPQFHFPGAFYQGINRGNQRCVLYWNHAEQCATLNYLLIDQDF